jgi:hypothetical protein
MKKHKSVVTRKRSKSKAGRPQRHLGDTTDFWDHFLDKKAKPQTKPKPKPKPKAAAVTTPRKRARPMATKKKEQETTETGEQLLPPPAPPAVESKPTEPPAPNAVIEQESVGAQPEDAGAVRELDLIPDSVYARGEGPRPEEPEQAPKEGGHHKKEKKEKEE